MRHYSGGLIIVCFMCWVLRSASLQGLLDKRAVNALKQCLKKFLQKSPNKV